MNFGSVLNYVIPTVVLAYAVYLAVRIIRNRGKRGCGGGCAGCPYASGCGYADKACLRYAKEENENER